MTWNSIKKLFETFSKRGIYLPAAYDADRDGPSVTLLGFHIGLLTATASVIAIHFYAGLLTATTIALVFFAMTFIFYKLRRLDKVSVDFDDKKIDLEGNSDVEDKQSSGSDPSSGT